MRLRQHLQLHFKKVIYKGTEQLSIVIDYLINKVVKEVNRIFKAVITSLWSFPNNNAETALIWKKGEG